MHGFRCTAHRLHQNVEMAEPLGHANDVLFFVHKILGHKTVAKINSPLIVLFLAGHVVGSDQVIDRPTRPANGGRDVVAWFDSSNIRSHFLNDTKTLMADDQMLVAFRSITV